MIVVVLVLVLLLKSLRASPEKSIHLLLGDLRQVNGSLNGIPGPILRIRDSFACVRPGKRSPD